MADARVVRVLTGSAEPVWPTIRHIVFWVIIVVAVGLSRVWFGGAFIVDFAAFMLACLWLFGKITESDGFAVRMTRTEMRDWVSAGMPEDVKSWQEARNG